MEALKLLLFLVFPVVYCCRPRDAMLPVTQFLDDPLTEPSMPGALPAIGWSRWPGVKKSASDGRCSPNVVIKRFHIQVSIGIEQDHNISEQLQLPLHNASQYSEAVPGNSLLCYAPLLIAFCQAALRDKIIMQWLYVCQRRNTLFCLLTTV